MTLIITELSSVGIAMVADSALTQNQGGIPRISEVRKIFPIPYLNAGISGHGIWEIDNLSTHVWLENFINSVSQQVSSIGDFARELARHLNAHFPRGLGQKERLGFHLAGYERFEGVMLPSFYHIHDGVSGALAHRKIQIDPTIFNANHDVPPNIFSINDKEAKARGFFFFYQTRNGDIDLYVSMFEKLGEFFKEIERQGIHIPGNPGLNNRLEFLRFQVETMQQIYSLSNLAPTIGGEIRGLSITPEGIISSNAWPIRPA